MKVFILLAVSLFMSSAYAFQVFEKDTDLGIFNKIKCTEGLECSRANDKVEIKVTGAGVIGEQAAPATSTLTAAHCGTTLTNSAAATLTLPEASTVIGCKITFIVGHASNFTINPEDADTIFILANAAGDAIQADAVGESVVLQAISATGWAAVGAVNGTWTDVN